MNHLLYSISDTLRHQLSHCFEKCLASNGIIKRFTSLWTSSLSHQTIQLATIIFLQQITLDSVQNRSLDLLLTDLQSLIQTLQDINQGNMPTDVETLSMTGLAATQLTGTTAIGDSTVALQTDSRQLTSSSNHSHINPEARESLNSISRGFLCENLIVLLLGHQQKVKELMCEPEPLPSFCWQSSIRYSYDQSERLCALESMGVALSYGFHYSGECPFCLTPPTERLMVHLLQVMRQQYNGLITNKQVNINIYCYFYPFF